MNSANLASSHLRQLRQLSLRSRPSGPHSLQINYACANATSLLEQQEDEQMYHYKTFHWKSIKTRSYVKILGLGVMGDPVEGLHCLSAFLVLNVFNVVRFENKIILFFQVPIQVT